jgi:hypothetical protein
MDFELATEIDAENPIIGDMKLTNGQLTFIGGDITDVESYVKMIAQRIKSRLLKIRGEWYLDRKKGFPWRERIWGKAGILTDEETTKGLFRQSIIGTPGVASIESLVFDINRQTRTLIVDPVVLSDTNQRVTVASLDEPFIMRI